MANELAGSESQSSKFPKEGLPAQPSVVEIYASWCGACKALDKSLHNFQKEFAQGKAQMVRIDGGDDKNQALLNEYKKRYADKLPEAFPNAFPTLLFIDGKGNLANIQQGYDVSQRQDGLNANDVKFAQNLGKIENKDAEQILNDVGLIDSPKAKDNQATATISIGAGESVTIGGDGSVSKTPAASASDNNDEDDDPAPYKNLSLPGTKGKDKVIEFYTEDQQATAVDEKLTKLSQASGGKENAVEFLRVNAKDPKYAQLVKAFDVEKYPTVLFLDAKQNLRSWFEGCPKNMEKQFARGVEQLAGQPVSIAEQKNETVQSAMATPEQSKETQAGKITERPAGGTTEAPAIHSLSRDEILKLTDQQRAGQFVRAVNVILGPAWAELAGNLIHCGKEARYHRYTNQVEPQLVSFCVAPPVSMALETTVGREALGDSKEFRQERKAFKEIAEYYDFGVSKKPIAITHDWQEEADKQSSVDDEADNPFAIGKASMNIDFADGRQYHLQCSESGQRMIVENGSHWLCKDTAKENATLQDLENKFYTWYEYKQQSEIFQPTGVSQRFAVNFDGARQALQFFNADGSVREETREGTLNYSKEEWSKKMQQQQAEDNNDKSAQ